MNARTPIRREVFGRQCEACGSLFAGARDDEFCDDCPKDQRYGSVTQSQNHA